MFKLPFFKTSSKKTSKFLTLEINSCEIKCLAFYKENGTLKVIGSATESLEQGLVRNGVISDLDSILEFAKSAVENATSEIEEGVADVIIGITSDICPELVTTAKIKRGSADTITQREVDEFQQKIMESALVQVQTRHAHDTGDTETDLEIITSSVVYTKVDEQKVENLVGRSAQTVEMAMYTAFSPNFHIQTLKTLSKKLGLNLLAISSEAFSLIKALKQTELESTDLILVQINGDFTNVSVVFGGAVVANKSLHIGKKHFIDEISRIMGLTSQESAKIIESHSKGRLSQSESVVVQTCLEDVLKLWLEGVGLLFSDFSGVKTFAPCIYLFGSATQIPEIEDMLRDNPWTKSIPFKAPPEIRTLEISDLNKIVDATGTVQERGWVAPAGLSYIYEELV